MPSVVPKRERVRLKVVTALVLLCLFGMVGYAASSPEPGKYKTLTQPDGTAISVYCFLDEFASYIVADGGLVVQSDEDGYYYYARFAGLVDEGFTFRPTAYLPGADDDSPEVRELQIENSDAMSLAAQLLRGKFLHTFPSSGEFRTISQPDGMTFPAIAFSDEFAA